MGNDYTNFIKAIELNSIKLISTSEKVFSEPDIQKENNVHINTEKSASKDDPQMVNNSLINYHKYRFEFIIDNKIFYTAEYEIFVSFIIKDPKTVSSLLDDKKIRDVFVEKQIDKLVWSYLRGIVMDGFNRHSLKPIPLPLLP